MSNANLDMIVLGRIKFARKQLTRERKTRFGFASGSRTVLDEFPDELADTPLRESVSLARMEYSQMRAVVQGQIREIVSRPEYIELIERRLLDGECLATVADELGINRQTARSQVRRAREALRAKPMKSAEL